MTPVDAGPPIAVVNPASGDLVESFEPYDAAAVEARLALAAAAAPAWATTTFAERARLLVTVAELFEAELPDIAHGMTTEMGKPFAQAKAEVAKCATGFRWFAEHAARMLTDEVVDVDSARAYVTYQPLGPVLAVMPWNFPLWQVTRFLAPAIMVGNVGLLKHAPSVPRSALFLEDVFRRAGAPDGVFQTLLIGIDQVPAVIADPRVAAVTLTGSVGAGRAVAAQAGAVGKKVVLELGGSDPFIVLPSADLERAVEVGVQARVQNNGQSCIAAKRFIVHRDVADAFTKGFVSRMESLVVGDPLDPSTDVGPLVTGAARDTLAAQVDDARSKGAAILCGGETVVGPSGPDRPGFFYRPTVITD
ncbi:MAG: aldehyde dehydrogenase family protein, partial [Acidimicrobiales bacterium]|nr:aldehyde dehydrogenase family protein [Acidimicrobiales bacterium]